MTAVFGAGGTAGALLERANSLVADEQWADAADQLYQYLRLRPEDGEAKIRLAEAYAHLALAPQFRDRAIEFHYPETVHLPGLHDPEPPDTEETVRTCDSTPSSFSRRNAPA